MRQKEKTNCGAKTKKGTPCRCKALANGKCRLHGGLNGPGEAERRIKNLLRKNGITDDDINSIMEGALVPFTEYIQKFMRIVDQSESIH